MLKPLSKTECNYKKTINELKYASLYVGFLVFSIFLFSVPFINDDTTDLFHLGINLWISTLGLFVFICYINSFFIGRRYDKKFKSNIVNDPSLDDKFYTSLIPAHIMLKLPHMRAGYYCFALVFPGRVKQWRFKSWFNGYDLRKDAKLSDYICSYALLTVVVVHFVGAGLMILNWIL